MQHRNGVPAIIIWALALCFLAGCAFSEADRQSIIAESARQAGQLAEATVFQKVNEEMLKQGKTVEEAREIAAKAAGIAKASAEAVAGKTADIATGKASAERSSTAGSWFTALLPALLGLVGAAAKKAVGA